MSLYLKPLLLWPGAQFLSNSLKVSRHAASTPFFHATVPRSTANSEDGPPQIYNLAVCDLAKGYR